MAVGKKWRRILIRLFMIFMLTAGCQPTLAMSGTEPLSSLTLEEKIGQLLMVDIRSFQGRPVTELPDELAATIRRLHVGGVILFRDNLANAEQTLALTTALQQVAAGPPLLIAVDQEGGRVNRLPWGTILPGNMALGAAGSPALAFQNGRIIGEELRALGINVDFAPVLDVNVNPANPVIGVRSFGSNPERVADLGVAWMKGVQSAGIAAAVKHFPGHGDTSVDSHVGLPTVAHDRARLNAVELPPFRAAIAQGTDLVMTAHIIFPALDNATGVAFPDEWATMTPATLSQPILTGLLRNELGFSGVIITDALEMKAIADRLDPATAALLALQAGADILLMPTDPERAYDGLLQAVRDGRLAEERIDASLRRIAALKRKVGLMTTAARPPLASINGLEHRRVAADSAEAAATLLRNEQRLLPFTLTSGKRIVLFAPNAELLDSMLAAVDELVAKRGGVGIDRHGFVYDRDDLFSVEQERVIAAADYVVLGSRLTNSQLNASSDLAAPDFLNAAIAAANEQQKPLAVLLLHHPYDIAAMPAVRAAIAVYGGGYPNIIAGMRTVFGDIRPQGKLPVAIFLPLMVNISCIRMVLVCNSAGTEARRRAHVDKKRCINHIQCVLVSVVLLVTLAIFYADYRESLRFIQNEHQIQRDLIEKSVVGALQHMDLTSRLIDKQVREEKKEILQRLVERYRSNPDVFSWDLQEIKKGIDPYHFYVIDAQSKVVLTTYPPDQDLDFSLSPQLNRLMHERRLSGRFISERLEVARDGRVKTYGYLATPDQRYLLETSLDIREKFPLLEQGNLITSVNQIKQLYPSVDAVQIYRLNRQGTTLRVIQASGEVGGEGTTAQQDEIREIVKSVLRDQQVRETARDEAQGERTRVLRYIPYQSLATDGRIDWRNSFVTAITYNDLELRVATDRQHNRLLSNCIMILMAFLAMMVSLHYFFHQAETSREQLASVLNLTSEGYCLLGLDLQFHDANAALCQMTGYAREELQAMSLSKLFPPQEQADTDGPLLFAALAGWKNRERVLVTKGNRRMHVVVNATQVWDGRSYPQYAFAFIHDITERKKAEEYINRMAYHDPLTDLPNRKLFYEKLGQELARCRRNETVLAVMFVDIDHFKGINDTYGHETGDLLLCEVSRRLKAVVRESDTVARLGGDEFTLLVSDLRDEEDATVIANKIMESFRKPAVIHGQALVLQCSVGVSLFPRDDDEPEELVRKADAAMYTVKKHGRNHWRIFAGEKRELMS